MKKAKISNSKKSNKKEEKVVQNDEINVRVGVISVVIMIVVFVGFYFLTDYLLSKRPSDNTPVEQENPNVITFNKLLEQKETEYYVLAILENDKDNTSKYKQFVADLPKVYYIDMSNSFNKNYMAEETVVVESVKDIRISDTVLFHIKSGKIEGHYVGYEGITKYLISLAEKQKNL